MDQGAGEEGISRFAGLALGAFIVTMVLAPLVSSRAFLQPFAEPKFFILDVGLALFVFFQSCAGWNARKGQTLLWIDVAACLLGMIMLATVPLAVNKGVAFEWSCRFILAGLAARLVAAGITKNPHLENRLLNALTAAVLVYLVALVMHCVSGEHERVDFSPIGHINYTAQVYEIWIPLLAALAVGRKGVGRWAALAALVGVLVSLASTVCRGAILGLFVGGAVVLVPSVPFRRMPVRRLAPAVLGGAALMAVLAIVPVLRDSAYVQDKIRMTLHNPLASSNRLNMWRNTWNMALDNPWGVGPGNFQYIHPRYAQLDTPRASGVLGERNILFHPHNSLFCVLAETGFAGLAAAASLLALLSWAALVNARRRGTALDLGILAAWIATCVHSLLSAVFYTPVDILYVVLLCGLLLGRAWGCGALRATPWRFPLRPAARAAAVCMPALIVIACLRLTSDALLVAGMRHRDPLLLERAARFDPWNERVYFEQGNLAVWRRDHAAMEAWARKFLELYPYNLMGLTMYADSLYLQGKFRECREATQRLLALDPGHSRGGQLDKNLRRRGF